MNLNRIGNKLGLAGLLGIVLAGGLIANQVIAEHEILAVNKLADGYQFVNQHSLEGAVGVRRMQVGVRDIRMARTPADTEKAATMLSDNFAYTKKEFDAALQRTTKPENKERFEKIQALVAEYAKLGSDQAATMLKAFEATTKRNDVAGDWSKEFDVLRNSPALAAAGNRIEIEKAMYEASSLYNAVRSAAWHFAFTGEENEKKAVVLNSADLNDAVARLRAVSTDRSVIAAAERFAIRGRAYESLTNEITKLQTANNDLEPRLSATANQSSELTRSVVNSAGQLFQEAKQHADSELVAANRISFLAAVAVMLSLVGSVIFSFLGVARPMTRLNGTLSKMANGELNIDIPGASRGDEVGDIAKTVVVISKNALQKASDEAATLARLDQVATERRKSDMVQLADSFEAAVGEIVETVSSASTELEASASTLTSTAERSQELTTMVAAASEEASTNVQAVASATEELSSSVNEISRQVQESARMANEAVGQARATNDRVGELSKAAARIGDVVELINTIAGQTNLLALNATIEAARAGEAGRGFAVVASEVKALAEQTAKATGEIGQQIAGIQAATHESVGAIREISVTIEKLSEISATIASAVEEQGAATQEISRNVQQAAQGTQQVSSNIANVQRGASETGAASSQVLSAAKSLSGDSNRLKAEVGKFLHTVRAA